VEIAISRRRCVQPEGGSLPLRFPPFQVDVLDLFRAHALLRSSAHEPLSAVDDQKAVHAFVHHHEDVFHPDNRDAFLLNALTISSSFSTSASVSPAATSSIRRRLGWVASARASFKPFAVKEGQFPGEPVLLAQEAGEMRISVDRRGLLPFRSHRTRLRQGGSRRRSCFSKGGN